MNTDCNDDGSACQRDVVIVQNGHEVTFTAEFGITVKLGASASAAFPTTVEAFRKISEELDYEIVRVSCIMHTYTVKFG